MKGETIHTPDRTALSIKVLATNFVRANSPNQPTRMLDQIWRKPDLGIVKINVDASFHADTMAGACGAVARDEHGTFIAAASWILSHVVSADSAEIYAIRFGLILAANVGCTKIVIESDSLNALEAASNPEAYMGGDAAVIIEATILAMEFSSVSFVHCRREANLVADSLAKHCFSTRVSEVWDSFSPDFILSKIINDLAII